MGLLVFQYSLILFVFLTSPKVWSFQFSISTTLGSVASRPVVRFGSRGTAYANWAYVFTVVGGLH